MHEAVLNDPTKTVGQVYDSNVDSVRDTLDDATRVEFDNLMPSEVIMIRIRLVLHLLFAK